MSRKHAHPLRALMRADRKMLWRQGIAPLYLLLTLLYIAVLRFWIPTEHRPLARGLLLLSDPAALSLFFMGAIVLYEKGQHSYPALYAAGVKAHAYVISKCVVMSLWSMVVGCAVCWFSEPSVLVTNAAGVLWETALSGDVTAVCVTAAVMLLGGVLFTCSSLMLSAVVHSLNGYLLASVLGELLLLVPAVVDQLMPLPAWVGFHPTVWLARGLRTPAAVPAWLNDPLQWAQAAVLLLWLSLAGWGACLAVRATLRGKGNA
ncbi:MAG: hypothetical protein RSC91_07985 [Clostridia bacterium]